MILGISGLAHSGKSTCSAFLREQGFVEIGFADEMKRSTARWIDFSEQQLWGSSENRDRPDCRYKRADGKCLSPRHFLQQLGTELGRTCYPNIWVDIAIRTAGELLRGRQTNFSYDPKRGLIPSVTHQAIPGVVFSDVRFKNELVTIQKAGGRVVRLKREMPTAWQLMVERLTGRRHVSEFEQLMIPDAAFDHVIDNRDMSLGDLKDAIEALID